MTEKRNTPQDDWNEEEEDENFNMAISQRTEELYRVPTHETDADGIFEALVLPLRDLVVFPHMVSPVFVDNEASILTLQTAHERNQTVIGLTQKDPEKESPKATDFLPVGVEMAVGRLLTMPDGNSSGLVQGRRRVQVRIPDLEGDEVALVPAGDLRDRVAAVAVHGRVGLRQLERRPNGPRGPMAAHDGARGRDGPNGRGHARGRAAWHRHGRDHCDAAADHLRAAAGRRPDHARPGPFQGFKHAVRAPACEPVPARLWLAAAAVWASWRYRLPLRRG